MANISADVTTNKTSLDIITSDWPAPSHVQAFTTTRFGGVSKPPFNGLNLALHVNDNPKAVAHNRRLVNQLTPNEPVWLNQTHSEQVADLAQNPELTLPFDASFSVKKAQVCAVMTADCLPLLITDVKGHVVAAIHAGWQGLVNGIIAKTINALVTRYGVEPADLLVWLGPAISQAHFEIGADVKAQLQASLPQNTSMKLIHHAFKPAKVVEKGANNTTDANSVKWFANVYIIAKSQLAAVGVKSIYGGDFCTYKDEDKFYSHRRATHQGLHATGRMASLIFLG